jgi:hypothetical protein
MGGRKYKKRKKHQPKNRPAGIPDEPKTANPATCEPPQEEKYMEYKPPDSTLTVWGFVVAALVLIVYAFQLKAMLESNKTNREGLESVQRAFVTFQRTQEQRIIGREPGFSKEEHWWSVSTGSRK